MEPLKKYYASISTLANTLLEKEKRLAALDEIEKQLNREFSGEKSHIKRPETSILSNFSNIENLFSALLSNLEDYNETSPLFLNVLCIACKHLLKKLKEESQIKICDVCLNVAEKAFAEKNWLLLEKCFKCFELFGNREWNNLLSNGELKGRIFKIIHSSASVGKDTLCSKNKQEFCVLQILCVEVLSHLLKTELLKTDDIFKPNECFVLLFPLLFDENCELRKIAYQTFVFLKNQCPNVCYQLLEKNSSLREQLKISYSKKLAHFARTNEPDWIDLWCFMVDLLGQECTARKNTDLINNLLQAEEIGFRSSNMNTRYNAFVGWKFLVNKFLDTSLEDSSRRLKLLMQPLITSNSKTTDILCIKFDIWWQLIMGIEPCIQRHVTNILYHFLNFCFGPVGDGSSVNNGCTNSDIPDTLASRRPAISNVTNYPLVTTRRWKGLEVNRADALAQILNLNDNPSKEFKLQHFKSPVISTPQIFLCLSKMLIHCVGECTILSIDCKEMSSQERKSYLKEIWKSLLLHVRKVYEMPTSSGQDTSERQEKTEMMKNMFRILLRLNEIALNNQQLANFCLNPVLETILSSENGLPDEVLTSRNYYVGTDVMMGTPLSILLDVFLSPAFLSIQAHSEDVRSANDVLYMVLLQRVVHLGVRLCENVILFTQSVLKRIDAVVSNIPVKGNRVKSIWILLARTLTSSYVGEERDINQGTEENADFSWLIAVLMFPVIHSKIFLTDQDMILRIWGQLDQAFQRNISSNVKSIKGNELCCIICSKVQQEVLRKKNIKSDELLHIMCVVTCAIEQIPFSTLNKLISCGNISESEKLGHIQQCFQVLQTLSVEIQKLKIDDNLYLPIVSQYAKCYQMFCNNLKECPLQFLTLFFIEQIQFILSIKIDKKETPSGKLFSSTCIRTWKSFLCILLSGCLQMKKQNKKTIVKMIQPALLSSFSHADHAIHEITINFSNTEDINMQTNYECNKCRIMQERMSTGRNSLLSPKLSSAVNDDGKLKELFARPLTKHQKEAFRQRRDDIPALYQDLTQDSQPSFSDSQDSSQMLAENPVIVCDEATSIGEYVKSPREASFQSKENIPLKKLLAESTDDSSKKTSNFKIVKCLNAVVSPNHTDHYVGKFEPLTVKSPKMQTPQKSQNEMAVIDTTPNSQKTSPVKNLPPETHVGRPTNAPLVTNIKGNLDSEAKKVNSESFHIVPNILKTKIRRQSPATTHHPIKVCISKLQTDTPEVKRIVLKLPIGSQKSSIRESKQTNAKNCNDILNTHNFVFPKASTCDENVIASSHNVQGTCNKLDAGITLNIKENIADTLTLTKNRSASDECNKSLVNKEENLNVISCQTVETSTDCGESKDMSLESATDKAVKETSQSNEQSSVKQMENDSVSSPNSKKVFSPTKVILKKLEMNDVNNYSCRALQFKDEHSNSEILHNETGDIHTNELGNSELDVPMLDLKPGSNLLSSEEELVSGKSETTSIEEAGELERESKDQKSVGMIVPKEIKSKSNISQTQDSESTSHADHLSKTKIPTPSYQTRSKAIKLYPFTRSCEKRKLSNKGEQNQKKNSPKENAMVAENVPLQKKPEAIETVNQRPSKALKTVQNYQNSLSSSYPSNKSEVECTTFSMANSKHNAVDKAKENKLEMYCSQLINLPAETENLNTGPQLANYVKNSCRKLSYERAGDECNQIKPKNIESSVCGPDTQQQQNVEELTTTALNTSQNKIEGVSSAKEVCAKETKKEEYTKVSIESLPEMDKPMQKKQVIGDCSNQELREKMEDVKSNISKSITHYFPVIPAPVLSAPSHENCKNESLTGSTSSFVSSESVGGGGGDKSEQVQSSVSESVNEMPQKNTDEHTTDLNKVISSTDPDTSYREVSSQISCDKGEYVRSLSLMPQNANSAIQPKAHKISTRSDWARRFGCRLEVDIAKNDDCFEKDGDENMNFSNDLSVGAFDSEDVVESSQPRMVVFKDCCISLPKLSITLGCILSGVEGDLMVSEEISSGLFRVTDKSCEERNDAKIESPDDAEKIEELESPICDTRDQIPESSAQNNPEIIQKVSSIENLPGEIEQSDLLGRDEVSRIKDSCKSPDITPELEDKGGPSTKCSESCDEKRKDEVIDLTFDEDSERENIDIKSDEPENTLREVETAVSEELVKDEKRKRKRKNEIYKIQAKKRRIMQPSSDYECTDEHLVIPENGNLGEIFTDLNECEPISHNNEETEKSSPPKFSIGSSFTNVSPIKIKRSKHLVKSEDSSPSRKHMSGRAAHLVDLALTKKSANINDDLPLPSTSSDVGLEESTHDVVFSFNAEGGEEKSPWVRSIPQAEASPGKTNLKRKLPLDDISESTPLKKSVRFSDPEVTRKLHFQKTESPEKTTFRIVRTKKGKLYVQKNTSNTKDRLRRMDRSAELKPVWPTLKDCTSPVTDVTEQLAVTGDCKEMLISSLDSRNICTVGELCSLTESDVDELPIKAPKIIVFKLVMQAYEDRIKNLQSYKTIRQQRLQQENCSGNITSTDLKAQLSSMSRDAVIDLLKESLSETDLKEVASNFNKTVLASSSTSVGIATEIETEEKASSTDDDFVQQLGYFLPETLKRQVEQNEQKKILNQVLQMLFLHCGVPHTFEEIWKVVSDSNFEPPKGNVNAVNQCFKFLQFLCMGSALPFARAQEFYQDTIRQFGVQSVLSEVLKCGESEHKSVDFVKDVINCMKEKLCAKQEMAAEVFQCLVTDNTIPLAIQHCTAKQLVPCVVNQCGDVTVLDTVLNGTTMTREKALESFKKYLSSEDVDEKHWMDTIFELISLSGIAKDKRNLMLTLLSSAIGLARYK